MLIYSQFVTPPPFLLQIPKKVGQVIAIQGTGTEREIIYD